MLQVPFAEATTPRFAGFGCRNMGLTCKNSFGRIASFGIRVRVSHDDVLWCAERLLGQECDAAREDQGTEDINKTPPDHHRITCPGPLPKSSRQGEPKVACVGYQLRDQRNPREIQGRSGAGASSTKPSCGPLRSSARWALPGLW